MHAKNVLASYLSELLLPSRCHDRVVAGSTRVAVALFLPGQRVHAVPAYVAAR